MEKEFVPYELALRLKTLGYNEPCMVYFEQGILKRFEPNFLDVQILNSDFNNRLEGHHLSSCSAPTWQSAFKWFREKYHIIGEVKFKGGKTTKTAWYDYLIYSEINWDDKNPNEQWKTYEEAETACLTKLIEIVENIK